MKVLLFIDSLVIGGAQRQLLNLASGLKSRGHQVHICTYYPLNGLVEKEHCDISVECFDKSFRFDISPIFKLTAAIKRFQADVIVAFLSTPCVYAELSRLTGHSVPVIVSERNGPTTRYFGMIERLYAPLHLLSSLVVFNNHAKMEAMGRQFLPLKRRSRLIYNGVDDRYFEKSGLPENSDPLTQSANRDGGRQFRFCSVSARPTAEKGLFDLIHAAAMFKASATRSFKIDWIGPIDIHRDEFEAAEKLINSLTLGDNWQWLGAKEGLEKVYGQYDAMLIPSRREGLSNVLCEAMASGLTTVATDIADHRRILADSGSGYVCKPQNPESLSRAISQIFSLESATFLVVSTTGSDSCKPIP